MPRAKRASWLVAGLTVLADWIGSNSDFFEYRQDEMRCAPIGISTRCPRPKTAVCKTGILSVPTSRETGPQVLFPDLFPKHNPTPLQDHAASCALGDGPQLFILRRPDGIGEDRSWTALDTPSHGGRACHGLYVALPTMATADAMYERVGDAYQRSTTVPRRIARPGPQRPSYAPAFRALGRDR